MHVYIISGSTHFLNASLEVWSGKHTINHEVSTFYMQWEKHYALNLPHPLPTLQQYPHSKEHLPLTSHSI